MGYPNDCVTWLEAPSGAERSKVASAPGSPVVVPTAAPPSTQDVMGFSSKESMALLQMLNDFPLESFPAASERIQHIVTALLEDTDFNPHRGKVPVDAVAAALHEAAVAACGAPLQSWALGGLTLEEFFVARSKVFSVMQFPCGEKFVCLTWRAKQDDGWEGGMGSLASAQGDPGQLPSDMALLPNEFKAITWQDLSPSLPEDSVLFMDLPWCGIVADLVKESDDHPSQLPMAAAGQSAAAPLLPWAAGEFPVADASIAPQCAPVAPAGPAATPDGLGCCANEQRWLQQQLEEENSAEATASHSRLPLAPAGDVTSTAVAAEMVKPLGDVAPSHPQRSTCRAPESANAATHTCTQMLNKLAQLLLSLPSQEGDELLCAIIVNTLNDDSVNPDHGSLMIEKLRFLLMKEPRDKDLIQSALGTRTFADFIGTQSHLFRIIALPNRRSRVHDVHHTRWKQADAHRLKEQQRHRDTIQRALYEFLLGRPDHHSCTVEEFLQACYATNLFPKQSLKAGDFVRMIKQFGDLFFYNAQAQPSRIFLRPAVQSAALLPINAVVSPASELWFLAPAGVHTPPPPPFCIPSPLEVPGHWHC